MFSYIRSFINIAIVTTVIAPVDFGPTTKRSSLNILSLWSEWWRRERKPKSDPDPKQCLFTQVPLKAFSLHILFHSITSCTFASQLPFDSCLFCVALTWEKALYEGGRTLKCWDVLCTVFLSLRLALCISDYDPEAPQMPLGCFCCGNRSVKRWDGGLPQWAVFVFCCCFVFLSLWVVPSLLFISHPGSRKTQKVSLPTSFSPSFISFSFSPLTPSLLHFSGNNLLLPFLVPEDWEIKSLLGLGGSVKIA